MQLARYFFANRFRLWIEIQRDFFEKNFYSNFKEKKGEMINIHSHAFLGFTEKLRILYSCRMIQV